MSRATPHYRLQLFWAATLFFLGGVVRVNIDGWFGKRVGDWSWLVLIGVVLVLWYRRGDGA